jgi:4-amino-4-deoxy-L-arabinose transferase-like glycosyltransferase
MVSSSIVGRVNGRKGMGSSGAKGRRYAILDPAIKFRGTASSTRLRAVRPATFALVGVMLGGSCFLGLARGLWTPDEPREAGISREMYEAPGVIPTLNGEPFIEKPPLYYWATALSFRLVGGPSVPAARAVSGLAGLLTLVVVFVWVRRGLSLDAAAVATVLLATGVSFVTSSHWVRIDIVLLFFCAIALWSAWERIGRSGGAGFLALFYAGLVLALWTKGLVGPVLTAAGLVTYAAMSRSIKVLAPLRPIAGTVVLAMAVAALAAAIAATGGASALRTWFWVNHVERFVHPVATGHENPFAYYVWTLPTAIAPWVVPFLALFHVKGPLWRRQRSDAPLLRFAAAMTLGPLVVLSLSSSKRGVYLLPLLPPLALLMASATLDRIATQRDDPRSGPWARSGDWLQAAILATVGMAPPLAHVVVTRSVTPISVAFLVAGFAMTVALAIAVARHEAGRAFWIGAGVMGLALTGAIALLVPRVDAIKDLEPFVAGVDAALPKGEPVRAMGADETLLGIVSFVTGRRVSPIETKDLSEGSFVLVQSVGSQPPPQELSSAYERVLDREFGPRRRIALWRRGQVSH